MTPPMATGLTPSQIISVSARRTRSFPSREMKGLTLPGAPDHDPPLFEEAKIEGMQGLAQFHHHEVGHIHDIVDGTKPHRLQPLSASRRAKARSGHS